MIIKKLNKEELEKFLDKQKEVNQLEKQTVDLLNFTGNKIEAKIEISQSKCGLQTWMRKR